ncbi:MAG: lactonase family protein [Gammaproteobacteria bacterium]|nr:lactonase family protein [Gammaproteobacteria bacterium]
MKVYTTTFRCERITLRAVRQLVLAVALLFAASGTALAGGKTLYLQSANTAEGQNSIVAYDRMSNGELVPIAGSPFLTGGTGIDNDTNGKLGPNDNDTPIVLSADGKRLFAVNGHSNTIAAFDILDDGALRHVNGSPFPSMGVGPVSLAISGDFLLVANRNEDPHQLDELRGAANGNYASFRILPDGRLDFVSIVDIADGQKPTQVLVSQRDPSIVFGNEFQVDADFDGDGDVSKLFSNEAFVRGRLRTMRLDSKGRLTTTAAVDLVETADPAPDVPTVPLGIWDHPEKNILYVGFVTRNQLGVYRYDTDGSLIFLTAMANSGQDICWLRVNEDGTRLYAVNNLPREDEKDNASTVTVFDVSGEKAGRPDEIGRVELPMPLGTFVNNRNIPQPNSTAFQLDIDPSGKLLWVLAQRIDQTEGNQSDLGNVLHVLKINRGGKLSVLKSRHLAQDGVHPRARPQGIVTKDT